MTEELSGHMDREQEREVAVEFDSTGRPMDVERETIEEAIREPFDPEKIDVVTRNPTVGLLLSRVKRNVLDLQPEFQRLAGIWSAKAQSRLIESMLLRIPLPTFYAAESVTVDERWIIVDGIQRLTAITRFVEPGSIGARRLVLANLEYLKGYEGKGFDGLPGRLQTRLLETEVVLHLIRRGTPEEVMFNIFARINTGGRPLTRQELRHALIPGPVRELLREFAQSPAYQNATLGSVSPERMHDREMVLRFIAFMLNQPDNYMRQDFDEFLRDAMRQVNALSPARVSQLRHAFIRALDAARTIFGDYAFRKRLPGQLRRGPVNKALFEAVSVNLAQRSETELRVLREQRLLVQQKLSGLLAGSRDFYDAISVGTGDIAKVRIRFGEVDKILKEITNA